MSHSFAAILFDFDGVIAHSEPLHYEAFREALAEEKIALSEKQYYDDMIGFDDRGFFAHLFKLRNETLDPKMLQRLMKRKGKLVGELIARGDFSPLPGAAELIRAVAPTHALAICSGARRTEVETLLTALGLAKFFPIIVAAEDVSTGKPDPSGYLLATQLVGKRLHKTIIPADCLIIEDAPTVAANAAPFGFTILGVTTSRPAAAWERSHAAWIVQNLDPAGMRRLIPGLFSEETAPSRRIAKSTK